MGWHLWICFGEIVDEMASCRCGCLRGWDRQRERSTAASAHVRADPAAARGSRTAATRWTDGLGAGTLALGRLPLRVEARPLCPEPAGVPPLRRRSLDLGATRRTVDLASGALGVEVGRVFACGVQPILDRPVRPANSPRPRTFRLIANGRRGLSRCLNSIMEQTSPRHLLTELRIREPTRHENAK